MITYTHLDTQSDVWAYKPIDNIEEYRIMVAFFDVDGKAVMDKKYAGTYISLSSIKDMRDSLLELRTLGYLINVDDLENISKMVN